jgi:hypothetical protein
MGLAQSPPDFFPLTAGARSPTWPSHSPRRCRVSFIRMPSGVLPILRGDCPGSDELPELFAGHQKKIVALACVHLLEVPETDQRDHGVAVGTAFSHSSLQ